MLAAWLSKAAAPFLIVALMLLAAAGLGWLAVATVGGLIDDARVTTEKERDAFWKEQIARSNQQVSDERSRQFERALAAEVAASARLQDLNEQKLKWESENAALPNGGDCGLDHRRVRLLAK